MFYSDTMNRKYVRQIFLGFLMFSLSLFFTVSGAQAAPNRVQVSVESAGWGNYNLKLTWAFTTGESLYVSTDGTNWSQINIGSPTNGQEFTVTDPTQRTSHSIVYYEVRDSGSGKKRVNVFPGTGENYANQHGNYNTNTNTCKNCHSTHKSEGARLMKEATIGALCDTCHSAAVSGGVGSRYMTDIGGVLGADGKFVQSLGGLFGRPTANNTDVTSPNSLQAGSVTGTDTTAIINEVWKEYKVGSETLGNSTSTHALEVSDEVAPGDTSPTRDMSCTVCHQGHPNNNNYRLLKSSINGSDIGPIHAYAVNSTGQPALDAASGMNLLEKGRYINNINEFCAQCHSIFKVGENAASVKGEGQNHYLHPVGVDLNYISTSDGSTQNLTTKLPLDNTNKMLCLTCHFAHGTPVADNSIQESNYIANKNTSMLKRRVNQAICEDCHKK